MKEKLLVSFSGGETSGFMANWIWINWRDKYDLVFVFANTGDENEETLRFVDECEKNFGFPIVWVEAKVFKGIRKSTGHKIVNFETAARNGQPFFQMVEKYGIPNKAMPQCTRELKQNPIKSFAKSIGWSKYYMAIGIRTDEIDRMNSKKRDLRLLYPLITDVPMTKPKINFWWSMQAFRLELKGYQGNCKACWKKSDNKLFQIAKETPGAFNVFARIERDFSQYIPETRMKLLRERGEQPKLPIVFYRGNRSVYDIMKQGESWTGSVNDDSRTDIEFGADMHNESCEVFAECLDENN